MNLVLGVSGSISAYKAVDILRLFQKEGHEATVVLTANAQRLVTPALFETFAPGRVLCDMWQPRSDRLAHVRLAEECELLLIAPATANIIGKMAAGIADDLLSTLYLAFPKRVVVAPAMNRFMYEHPAVVDNLALLRSRGVEVIEPETGALASGDEGRGRLPAAEAVYRACCGTIHV